ncbi:MAG TPA: FHA domain-containing protein [Phycisphaerae bacterium]|nr:FHA domain-containing protein [Phycisphaerae bacterium]
MSNKPEESKAADTDPQSRPDAVKEVDAYSEYLQLAEGHRPPHLYQLLDIELFCPHPERINQAVRRQFRKIKPYEENPDRRVRERIQDVMTHIATAKTVLNNPVQKKEYDERLAKVLKINRDEYLMTRTAARPPEFCITVIAGPAQVGSRFELLPDQMVTLGTSSHTTVCLPSLRLAKLQATIDERDDHWVIKSADNSLVMIVNDTRCQEHVLEPGDVIDLVGYRILFSEIAAPARKASSIPPPLSLVVHSGPSVPDPLMNMVSPATVLIGSCDTALWQLMGKGVSLHHARVEADGAFWQLRDLRSDTGTMLNGDKVSQSILSHRDVINLGPYEIQVRLRK